jgi:prephenate dehydrogenase
MHGAGLRDTTRIAASSPELWADIFLDNRDSLLLSCSQWSLQVAAIESAIRDADRDRLVDLLREASQWRKGFQ